MKTTNANKTKAASHLSGAFLEEIKVMLLAEQEKFTRELSKFTHPDNGGQEFDSKFPQFGDKEDENAAEVAEYAANLSIEQDLEKTLRDVKSSLERIAKGTYGICKYCNKPIEEKRLKARPTSSACIDCKKALTQEA